MLSLSTKKKLMILLNEIGEKEKNLEVLRQILCEQSEFEPYAAFRRIDRSRKGFITSSDVLKFLVHNGFNHKESECNYFIDHYDRDGDDHLIYAEYQIDELFYH